MVEFAYLSLNPKLSIDLRVYMGSCVYIMFYKN